MRLSWIRVTLCVVCVLTGGVWAQEGKVGHIQVVCPSGVQIFLDGALKGITSDDVGGIILGNVPPGTHTLKAVKPGCQPQEDKVNMDPGQVLKYTVKPLIPKLQIEQEGKQEDAEIQVLVGTLVIQSLPVDCTIDIPSLGVKGVRKEQDLWRAKNVPVGSHPL